MNLDFFKSGAKAWKEKKTEYTEKKAEWEESFEKFQEAEACSERLDQEIQREFAGLEREYQQESELLAEECRMLESQRFALHQEIEKKLEDLQTARAKLTAAASGMYGAHFQEALGVCERSIQNYRELLDLLEEDARDCQGDAAASRRSRQRETTLLTELQVQEAVIPMLVSMTKEQRAAVSCYTGSGYKQINPYLRRQTGRPEEGVLKQIQALHSLLENQRLKTPMTVYRGVSHNTAMIGGSKRGLNTYSDEELCGKLLVDGAFVSTSLRENSAFPGTMLVLDLPAGTRGAYVGDISTLQHEEREFLMDKDQAFRVTKVERRNGKRYIYAKSLKK